MVRSWFKALADIEEMLAAATCHLLLVEVDDVLTGFISGGRNQLTEMDLEVIRV